jgi:hypothetical protein
MKVRQCLLILFAGCTSSPVPTTTPEPDASSLDSGIPTEASASDATMPEGSASDDAGDDSGAPCNTIANDAPVVDVTQVAADPPPPQGGTIADGTYWQTSLAIYTGPNGPTGTSGTSQMTAQIQGEIVQIASADQPTRRTVTLMTSDAGFTSTDTCPTPQTAEGYYTATPTTLMIFLAGGTDDAGARTVVETLTKQ